MSGRGPQLEREIAAAGETDGAHNLWAGMPGGAGGGWNGASRHMDGETHGDHRRGWINHRAGGLEAEGVIDRIGAPTGAQLLAGNWGWRRRHCMARQARSSIEELGGHLRGYLTRASGKEEERQSLMRWWVYFIPRNSREGQNKRNLLSMGGIVPVEQIDIHLESAWGC